MYQFTAGSCRTTCWLSDLLCSASEVTFQGCCFIVRVTESTIHLVCVMTGASTSCVILSCRAQGRITPPPCSRNCDGGQLELPKKWSSVSALLLYPVVDGTSPVHTNRSPKCAMMCGLLLIWNPPPPPWAPLLTPLPLPFLFLSRHASPSLACLGARWITSSMKAPRITSCVCVPPARSLHSALGEPHSLAHITPPKCYCKQQKTRKGLQSWNHIVF